MRPKICAQLRPRVVDKLSAETTSKFLLGLYSEKLQVFFSSGQGVCCGLVKQTLRENAGLRLKIRMATLSFGTCVRNNVMLAGRDTTACLLSWTLSVKSYICVARPASKTLVQRIIRTKCISLASNFFTQTLLSGPGADHGAKHGATPGALKAQQDVIPYTQYHPAIQPIPHIPIFYLFQFLQSPTELVVPFATQCSDQLYQVEKI